MDPFEKVMIGLLGFFGTALVFSILFAAAIAVIDAGCKEAGWTRGELTIGLKSYCYSRINGSDFVIPYDNAIQIGHPRQLWRDK